MNNDVQERDLVESWINKITTAENKWKEYHDHVKEVREYYRNEKKQSQHNIFWSSIETLKPFLYFKQPVPYIDRKNKNINVVESAAAQILEKALEWDLEQFDFDSVIKYVRNDYLLSGAGLAYEKYEPTFKKVLTVNELGERVTQDIIDEEKVVTEYIDPVDFIADSEKVGIWEDCQWWARVIHMKRKEVVKQFGADIKELLIIDEKEDYKKDTVVYEIYDRESEKIYYLSKDVKSKFLKTVDDLTKVTGFFPMPKPIFTTQTNNTLVPISDYAEIKVQLKELDGLTDRMRLVMQALKVSGCYDNSFPELANILSKDVSLVSLNDFDKLKESGGIKGIMDFIDITPYVEALTAMAQRKSEIIQNIYEITGVSDIMRGNSNPNETATAVNKKTNFGTLRNQDRQNDMQRFITGLFKIKAEIICERFAPETLLQFKGDTDEATATQAINLLKTNKLRGLTLGIETDVSFNQSQSLEQTQTAIKAINDIMNIAFNAVTEQPLLLPLYKQMIGSIVSQLPNARQFESIIDDVFDKIGEELKQAEAEDANIPDPRMVAVQNQAQKNAQDYEIKKEQNRLKADELAMKKDIENQKVAQENIEANMQFALKRQQQLNGDNVSANITTGRVPEF